MQDKKYMTKRERVKDLSNKAEGIYYYIGPQYMLFRLINTGNELASEINHAVAYFTSFAQNGVLYDDGACAIACDMAQRMGVSYLFVMQNLYVVHGQPTWSGKSCKALIDNSGEFSGRTRYRMEGQEGTDSWGCRLIGVDKLTGENVEGPKVTVKMAKDAGWWNKNGSYWPRMTEMMLKYRAAAYFARAECPEVLMGANIDYESGAGDSAEEEV